MNDKSELIDEVLKNYRSKVTDITQQYWGTIGTGKDTGVTTELLNKIDDEAKAILLKAFREVEIEARIDELNKMPSPAYIGSDGIRLELIAEYKNHRLAELTEIKEKE